MQNPTIGPTAVHLIKGILYADRHPEPWEQLLRQRLAVEEYFAPLRLQVLVDESEGYAYLRQQELEENDAFPRLMSRRSLSYYQTVLLVLLRKRLIAFEDAGQPGSLVLAEEEMLAMMRVYWDELETNERKRERDISAVIKKLDAYGFLAKLRGERGRYEVKRIIKAYLPITELQDILERLRGHHRRTHGAAEEE